MADQNTPGVIAQARATAPAAIPAPQQVSQAPAVPEVTAPQQGFGGVQPNGFAQQQPMTIDPIVQQPAIQTDNDRTRQQFDKILESNQRIAQQNELLRQQLEQMGKQRQQTQQQFAPVTQPQVPQIPGQPQGQRMLSSEDFVAIDPETGARYIDEKKFNAAVAEMYQKASKAEEVVQNYVQQTERREVERNEREAYAVYNELNPQSQNFDQRFAKQTRAFVYDSLVNPQDYGGRPLSFKEAADYAKSGLVAPQTTTVATPVVNTQNQVQKEQASFGATAVPQQMAQNIDTEREYGRLITGTRTGSDQALAIRLHNASHLVDDVEGMR